MGLERQRRAEDKAARFDASDIINFRPFFFAKEFREIRNRLRVMLTQQWRNITEQNTRFGEIRYVCDKRFIIKWLHLLLCGCWHVNPLKNEQILAISAKNAMLFTGS